VAVEALEAFNGELMLVTPAGARHWTDLTRVAVWCGEGVPDECRRGLWRGEERHLRRTGAFMSAVDGAVEFGVRTGVLLPHDAALIVAHAEEAVRLASLPAALRSGGMGGAAA
jgi:hypothetical protein